MQKKLMATYILIISLTIIIAVLFCWHMGNKYFKDTTLKYTETKGELLTDILANEAEKDRLDFSSFVDEYSSKSDVRLTIIDVDGTVVADSDEDFRIMDNHIYRKEVSSAIKGEIASNIRYSETIGAYYLYTAIPIDIKNFKGVLRLSLPLIEIRDIAVDMIIYVIYGILIGAVVAVIIAYIVTRKFMQPLEQLTKAAIKISEGNYNEKIYIRNKDETGKLAEAFNDMTVKLSLNMWKLEKRNHEFECVLSSMINGIIAVDEQYNVFLYNSKLGKILDIDTDIVGKSIYEIIRNTTIFNVLEKSIEQNEYIVDETVINDKIIRVYANPIFAPIRSSIKNMGTLLVIRDITDIKKLETMRSDFVSNVTHELNTPLTSIRGFVDTLKNGAIKDEKVASRFLDIIDIETERLTLLIQDILSLSAIENMEDEKNNNVNNMASIINEVIEILNPKIKDRKINVNIQVNDDITYNCNRNRIKQLIINLTDNAIKYTEKGHIDIICKESDASIIIEVSDTGIGIEEEHIPRLIERFYRVDKGRSRNMGGTGLGLSIVKHIVSLYNGKIEVDSIIGEGTTFRVLLPKKSSVK
ncbi:PAS domain-containing sensor histidine kinase [Vallitalea longa]|uniref:histidine kinase n=1 Tax=Vallitalea longa TaxID=2936439 RepID=A0A9W6DHK3_9FIRM|nr:ATP-binding protein [Vallitalea longa]GKX30949.1 PAS domain-containing sensor histidine kinase [Vallitalea longa]